MLAQLCPLGTALLLRATIHSEAGALAWDPSTCEMDFGSTCLYPQREHTRTSEVLTLYKKKLTLEDSETSGPDLSSVVSPRDSPLISQY